MKFFDLWIINYKIIVDIVDIIFFYIVVMFFGVLLLIDGVLRILFLLWLSYIEVGCIRFFIFDMNMKYMYMVKYNCYDYYVKFI